MILGPEVRHGETVRPIKAVINSLNNRLFPRSRANFNFPRCRIVNKLRSRSQLLNGYGSTEGRGRINIDAASGIGFYWLVQRLEIRVVSCAIRLMITKVLFGHEQLKFERALPKWRSLQWEFLLTSPWEMIGTVKQSR